MDNSRTRTRDEILGPEMGPLDVADVCQCQWWRVSVRVSGGRHLDRVDLDLKPCLLCFCTGLRLDCGNGWP